MGWYDQKVRRVRDLSCGDTRVFLDFSVRRVACRACGKVKRERLAFLADNPLYTKRFAYFVGRRSRQATIKDVAKELNLDWHTIKEVDKQYMAAQLARAGTPGPKIIGLDEVSVRKGHTYFGGTDRSETSMGQFYAWLGPKKSRAIRLAVMWKPFRNATAASNPELADKIFVWKTPAGAVRRLAAGAPNSYIIWKFARNKATVEEAEGAGNGRRMVRRFRLPRAVYAGGRRGGRQFHQQASYREVLRCLMEGISGCSIRRRR